MVRNPEEGDLMVALTTSRRGRCHQDAEMSSCYAHCSALLHVACKFPSRGELPRTTKEALALGTSFLPFHPPKSAEQICQEYQARRSPARSYLPTKHSESKHWTMTYGLKLQSTAKTF